MSGREGMATVTILQLKPCLRGEGERKTQVTGKSIFFMREYLYMFMDCKKSQIVGQVNVGLREAH